jgi:hypothetical protein
VGVVAGAEFGKSSGQDCAFEMEMKLGFGEPADEGFDLGHSFSLAGA